MRAAVRRPPEANFPDGVEVVQHPDLAQSFDWSPYLQGIEQVVHLAGIAHTRGIAAEPLARRIDQFLVSRGYTPPAPVPPPATSPAVQDRAAREPPSTVEKAAEFVCEEDVRQALRQGRKIVIGDRSIVTPAARDLGDQHKLFVDAGLRR